MSPSIGDLTDFLVRRQVISMEQAIEAWELVRRSGGTLGDALVRLGYVTPEQVMRAVAELCGVAIVDLKDVVVPPAVLELLPESVARENVCLPLAQAAGGITVALSDATDTDTVQKLRFILNKDIHVVLALREQIVEAIHRHYGQSESESVDSFLQEFTDTAIEFDRTPGERGCSPAKDERRSEEADAFETDFEVPALPEDADSGVMALDDSDTDLEDSDHLSCDDEREKPVVVGHPRYRRQDEEECARDLLQDRIALPAPRSSASGVRWKKSLAASPPVERQATVRYYHRMNPQRMFPLVVTLSKKQIAAIVKRSVSQVKGQAFYAAADVPVEVEPILPGCHCYPPCERVSIKQEQVSVTFWVVPHVLGKVMHARALVRQDGKVLSEIPLEVKVVRQGLTLLLGCTSFVLPFALMMLKHFRLDLGSQMEDGFSVYARLLQWCLQYVSPEVLAGGLLLTTLAAYLWLRPRRRDVFWDIQAVDSRTDSSANGQLQPAMPQESALPSTDDPTKYQTELLERADFLYEEANPAQALRYYESGLALGQARPIVYHRAALAASQLGDQARALALLERAVHELAGAGINGVMWYNMGCFATRLGRFDEAMTYLHRAVDAGFRNVEKFHKDADLSPLRWREDFQTLLRSVATPSS